MADALVGYTGFVGSNLLRQRTFDDLYNSRNIENIAGRQYELLVCSGAPAEKWKANREPEQDYQNIQRLLTCLERVSAREVIVVSTVDVYPVPHAVDEYSLIDESRCHPYGRHRLLLEKSLVERFDATVIRLPGLFGKGLKKNIIYDLLHHNHIEQVHSESVFQFYHLDNLWGDIRKARGHGLKLINFATEPMSVCEVAHSSFGIDFDNRPNDGPAQYDFRSRHAALFGGSNGYLYSKQQVLAAMATFVTEERSGL